MKQGMAAWDGAREDLYECILTGSAPREAFGPLCPSIERDIISLYNEYTTTYETCGQNYTTLPEYERVLPPAEVLAAFREKIQAGITYYIRSVLVQFSCARGLWEGITREIVPELGPGNDPPPEGFPARTYLEHTFEPFHYQIEWRMGNRLIEREQYRIEFIPSGRGVEAIPGEGLHITLL
jgi:hypothetical protein